MFLSFTDTFDIFKVAVLPFVSILIPLVLSYWVAKKTNVAVGLLTIVLYCSLIGKFADDIAGVNENLALILSSGMVKYLSPIYGMFNSYIFLIGDLTGLTETLAELDPLVLALIVWGLFLILAMLGHFFKIFKFISGLLVWILGIVLLVVLFLAVFSKNGIPVEMLSIL